MAERKIDGKTYKVDPLPAVDAIKLYADMMRVVGPATGRLPALIYGLHQDDEGQRMMADVAALAGLGDILKGASSDDIAEIIRRIVEVARVHAPSGEWRQVDLNGDFTGNLAGIVAVVRFVVEEQFRDFFLGSGGSGVLSLLREGLAKRK